jgi:translocation and assembly module TamB
VAELGRLSRLIGLGLGGAGDIQMTGYLTPLEGGFDLKIDAETQDLSLGISQIDPLLTGQGTLFIQGARDESGTRIEQLTIGTSGLNANAQATLTSTGSTGEFAATVPDVSRSDPRIQGRASLTGTAVIDANGVGLFGVDVTAPGEVIGRVDATVGSDETKYATTLTAVLNGRDLSAYAGLVGQQIGGAARIEIAGNGMLAEQTFEANIDAATTSFRIGSPQVDRVLRGAGQLAATIERDQDGALRVDELHVQTPNIALTGTYTAQANTTNADFDARLRDLGLFASEFSGPATAEGTARQSGGVWQIDTRFTAPQSIAGQVSGQIASDGDLNLTATGQIPLALANDALDPRRLNGIAQFDLAVNGPPKPGSLNGRITTTDARFSAPILSRALQDIDATITLANGGAMVAMTGDISTGGRISIDGTVGMDIPFRGDLAIALRDVLLRDPTLFETTARGDITVRGPLAGGATVAGVVTLGAVEVQVPSSGFGTIGNIPTITHIGASRAVQTTQTRAGLDVNATDNGGSGTRNQPYNLNLTINAPARIFIRGRGLDAELGGSLRVAGTTNQVIPQGQFDLVRGRFSILGQRFDLTQGSASLQGDFNPYLRLVASTQRDGETIDVTLEGPADAPEISFSSTSGLPQDEVLAQLLFGKTLDSISPLQAVQLASAVATLAGKGGGAMEGLRNSFGLDNLDLTTDDNGNAAVRAGAYISENVYTDITVGNDGTSEINLNLDLSPSLTVKGSFGSDGGTGIGIFFEQDY